MLFNVTKPVRPLFQALRLFLSTRKHRRRVRQLYTSVQRCLPQLIAKYRYDVGQQYGRLGLTAISDSSLEAGTALLYVPLARLVRVNPALPSHDQRMALTMLLVHLASTQRALSAPNAVPYTIYRIDLDSPEGPAKNEAWQEYMQAMDCVAPLTVILALTAAYPTLAHHLIPQILDIGQVCYRQRISDIENNAVPVVNPLLERELEHLLEPSLIKASVS